MKKYIIYILIITLLVFLLLSVLDIINITNYVPFSHNYDWLGFSGGFFGSIIGGSITFLGVYLTLKFQKNSDDEEKRLSIIPIFEYKLSYNKYDFDNSNGQLNGEIIEHINIDGATFDDGKSEEWYFNLIAENIGLGHAQILGI